jgi:hypothetical protein
LDADLLSVRVGGGGFEGDPRLTAG